MTTAALIATCVMESYFSAPMAERDLLFHELVAPHLAAYPAAGGTSEAQQRDFITHLHATLNAPSHPICNRLLRLTADSPDLLAIIKQEGRVLILSFCPKAPPRATRDQSIHTTRCLLLFAEETHIAHASPGGTLEKALSGLSLENRE